MPSRTVRVTKPTAAAALLDPKRRRLLVAFMAGERSLAEAARSLAMPLNSLHHHVMAFVRDGLLVVARQQSRAGRPIRFYRASGDAFILPASAMRGSPGDALAAELRAALNEAELRSGGGDLLLSVDERGRPRLERTAGEMRTGAAELWRILRLDPRDARQLQADVGDLFSKYEKSSKQSGKSYLIHFGMARRKATRAEN